MKDKKLTLRELENVIGGLEITQGITPQTCNLAPPSQADLDYRHAQAVKFMAEIEKKHASKMGFKPLPESVQTQLNKALNIH